MPHKIKKANAFLVLNKENEMSFYKDYKNLKTRVEHPYDKL